MNDIEKAQRMLNALLMKKGLPIAILLIYLAGMVLMLFASFSQGLTLWFISTVLGALLLYVKHTLEKKIRDLQEVEAEEKAYQEKHAGEEEN